MSAADTFKGRACGKAILFGEHFVLRGGTAVAVPIRSVHLEVSLTRSDVPGYSLESRHLPPVLAGELITRALAGLGLGCDGLIGRVTGDLPAGMGLGGSAALCVSLLRAMESLFELTPDEDQVSVLAADLDDLFHGRASGIDTTTIAFEEACFIRASGTSQPGNIDSAAVEPVAGFLQLPEPPPLLIALSNRTSSTVEAVARLSRFAEGIDGAAMMSRLTEVADTIAVRGANALKDGAWDAAGDLMNENHYLLDALELSTSFIEKLRRAALEAGAWGAKVTGAGMGGAVAVMAPHDKLKEVEQALLLTGSSRVLSVQ